MTTRYVSSIFMMLILAWLTISIPFVYAAQQATETKALASSGQSSSKDDKDNNPFANTTEEKTSSNTSFSEEYLHEAHSLEHFQTEGSNEYKIEQHATYIAFYGELLSPPPDHS